MREDFLHYVWQFFYLGSAIKTTTGEAIIIHNKGTHNLHAGADFFNAKIEIGKQLWAGNVEIHLKSSDWYLHQHQEDSNYDNVILHVVWEHDAEIYRKDNSPIPTLVLKGLVPKSVLDNYQQLFDKNKTFINCENQIKQIDNFTLSNWLERLYFERLRDKTTHIEALLMATNNDWEATLFHLLLKNFGLKINGQAFYALAKSIPFAVFRKEIDKSLALEALLFGQAGLLQKTYNDIYFKQLLSEYQYYQKKYKLEPSQESVHFFKLRPANFPTIRLSQLVALYVKNKQLVAAVIALKTPEEAYQLFEVATSIYWETHYNFDLSSKKRIKKLTKSFIDLVLINTIVPFQFYYHKKHQTTDATALLQLIQGLKKEKNNILDRFEQLGVPIQNAQESQAFLQLYTNYCSKRKCLHCAIGTKVLKN